MAFQALKHKHHEFIHIVNTSNAHSVHGDRQDEPTGMSSDDPAGEVQSMEQKRGSPNRLVQGCPFSLGGGDDDLPQISLKARAPRNSLIINDEVILHNHFPTTRPEKRFSPLVSRHRTMVTGLQ